MYDSRAIANKMLDAAARYGFKISNLKLQKLLFFAHTKYLMEKGESLLIGEFEAWQYGPVHPAAYSAFKEYGAGEITGRARSFNPVSREYGEIAPIDDIDIVRLVDSVMLAFGPLEASKLVDLTHVEGGPWDVTIKQAQKSANVGLKIKNDTIRQHSAMSKIVVRGAREESRFGDVHENAPYSGD